MGRHPWQSLGNGKRKGKGMPRRGRWATRRGNGTAPTTTAAAELEASNDPQNIEEHMSMNSGGPGNIENDAESEQNFHWSCTTSPFQTRNPFRGACPRSGTQRRWCNRRRARTASDGELCADGPEAASRGNGGSHRHETRRSGTSAMSKNDKLNQDLVGKERPMELMAREKMNDKSAVGF